MVHAVPHHLVWYVSPGSCTYIIWGSQQNHRALVSMWWGECSKGSHFCAVFCLLQSVTNHEGIGINIGLPLRKGEGTCVFVCLCEGVWIVYPCILWYFALLDNFGKCLSSPYHLSIITTCLWYVQYAASFDPYYASFSSIPRFCDPYWLPSMAICHIECLPVNYHLSTVCPVC